MVLLMLHLIRHSPPEFPYRISTLIELGDPSAWI